MTIISFDPGRTTGVAVGESTGTTLITTNQYTIDELYKYLDKIEDTVDTFIIEKFSIRPNKATSFIWSDMEVIQVIGALKYRAHQLDAKIVIQEPTVKSIGYKWAGIEPPKNHTISHSADAFAHLVFYWVKTLGFNPPFMKRDTNAAS